ncbi:M81 family metallopeptidase [Paraburkholderia sp. Ac-20340]|uniref:M81 family metallopeptidase n=1 Tax=Paraburkholderia sp. Ac-20340 TaxID=2703888 RepID=UPI00197FD796|nr:M81 family metallopeptidase [Paraburkholderia sp. Ac-20340]MBN3853969.1 M81 family metallopeptidase [Paraburkholderia sp. Ac-20340]
MEKRVGIAAIFHETNTYASRTSLGDFSIQRGEEINTLNKHTRTYIGGMLAGCDDERLEAVPLFYAEATPSGKIERCAYEQMKAELLSLVQDANLDGLLLPIHGAGVSEEIDSVEGDLCEALKEALPPGFPVVATLDLHGNLEARLGQFCSALFAGRFNPHVDQFERGWEAAKCIGAMLRSELVPEAYVEQIPFQFPPVPTSLPVFVALDELCQAAEARPGVLAARIMHGFPFADIPAAGASVCVTTDSAVTSAEALAKEIASAFWQQRENVRVSRYSAQGAVNAALNCSGERVLINEFSDNTGGGAPGDGTHLLRALLDSGVSACFSHVFDKETVAQAAKAGVGAVIDVRLGGKTNPMHGDPIVARAEVMAVGNGRFTVKSNMGTGETIDLGLLTTLRIGSMDIIVSSGRRQTLDDGWFIKAGVDIEQYPVVALKSSQHFRAYFGTRFSKIFTADPPGISSADLSCFPRQKKTRHVWPLDTDATYPQECSAEK